MFEKSSVTKDSRLSRTPAVPPSRPPSVPPMTAASSALATTSPTAAPRITQYQYQAGASDPALTKQLYGWIFEGRLDQITSSPPNPPIWSSSSAVLCPVGSNRDNSSFEQVTDGSRSHESLSFAFPYEINILADHHNIEAGVLY
jgi:hypothetical protein